MAERIPIEQRSGRRVAVAVDVQLGRKVGNAVQAWTHDLSVGGARVVSPRPLRVDEELRCDLELSVDGGPISMTARVLRQHRVDEYALRFENVSPAAVEAIGAFVDAKGDLRVL